MPKSQTHQNPVTLPTGPLLDLSYSTCSINFVSNSTARSAVTFPARSAFRKNTGSCAPAHRRQKWLSRVACNRAQHTLKFGAHLGRTRPCAAPSTCYFQPGRTAPLSKSRGHLLTCQTALRCSAQEPDRKAVRGTDPDHIKEAHACLCALSP